MIKVPNASDINFQEEGNPNGYVVVCKHIANKSLPVLHIEMNIPYDKEHSGWEAICNAESFGNPEEFCDVNDFVNWPMKDFLEYEPSLKDLIKNPLGLLLFYRDNKNSPWKRVS